MGLKEAKYYKKLENNVVQCTLCPNYCIIPENCYGICGARKNINGKLYSLVYGKPIALNIDPIEKKPLYHFLPGTYSLSIGTVGCNFKCIHCQNWDISMAKAEDYELDYVSPEEIIKLAKKYNCPSISYTYNEPTVFYEYMLDISKLAKKENIRNVMVTNGYINEDPLKELLPYIDAANIDIKAMDEKSHKFITPYGKLENVLNTIKILFENKKWIEITYLVIPSVNDSREQINKLADFVLNELSENVPVHVNAFHPDYKLTDVPPTPYEELLKIREILVNKGIKFVYIGNVVDLTYQQTYCPNCNKVIIQRAYLRAIDIKIKNGKCPYCGTKIPGVWS